MTAIEDDGVAKTTINALSDRTLCNLLCRCGVADCVTRGSTLLQESLYVNYNINASVRNALSTLCQYNCPSTKVSRIP